MSGSNHLVVGECSSVMNQMKPSSVDMVLTSPPYDTLRVYRGFTFNFEQIAKAIYRVIKPGGVLVWVVGDKTEDGSETGTSFRQALYFKEIGFNLHDTMIYHKHNPMPNVAKNRYTPAFEYMFVLSKGKPKTTNMLTTPTKYAGKVIKTYTSNPESIRKANMTVATKPTRIRHNIWSYTLAGTNFGHPAIFPEKLAEDHILSWSNPGDLVLDPMAGSGTTVRVALKHGRRALGIDISEEYCRIAQLRCATTLNNPTEKQV